MTWINLIGYLAAVLMFITFFMKKMIPLRALGASANVTFVVYASITHIYPLLILHAALFPLNITRMIQMMNLVKKVKEASKGNFSMEFLAPYMKKETLKKGDTVFNKGDEADKMYYLQSGTVCLKEFGITLQQGEVIGEIGIFSKDRTRTATVVCESDVDFLTINESQILQLYYQNPKFGYYLVQLIIQRLLSNADAGSNISTRRNN